MALRGEKTNEASYVGRGKRRCMLTSNLRLSMIRANLAFTPHGNHLVHPHPRSQVIKLVARVNGGRNVVVDTVVVSFNRHVGCSVLGWTAPPLRGLIGSEDDIFQRLSCK